eukprot:1019187-Pleurochrysis_carterae.AAC.1
MGRMHAASAEQLRICPPAPTTRIGGVLSRERHKRRSRGDWRRGRKQWRAGDALSGGPLAVPVAR